MRRIPPYRSHLPSLLLLVLLAACDTSAPGVDDTLRVAGAPGDTVAVLGERPLEIDLEALFAPGDGGALTFEASSESGLVELEVRRQDSARLVVTPLRQGRETIRVTARDPQGGTALLSFHVDVLRPCPPAVPPGYVRYFSIPAKDDAWMLTYHQEVGERLPYDTDTTFQTVARDTVHLKVLQVGACIDQSVTIHLGRSDGGPQTPGIFDYASIVLGDSLRLWRGNEKAFPAYVRDAVPWYQPEGSPDTLRATVRCLPGRCDATVTLVRDGSFFAIETQECETALKPCTRTRYTWHTSLD